MAQAGQTASEAKGRKGSGLSTAMETSLVSSGTADPRAHPGQVGECRRDVGWVIMSAYRRMGVDRPF